MEVFLYNSTVCRLCGEENDNGTFLYSSEENNQNISALVNSYLPIKVCDDGQLPRTICPGCTIQLEATVEFINLIINGQKVIRALHQREIEYKKTVLISIDNDLDNTTSANYVQEVNIENGAFNDEHPASLQVAGLEKPKRKRGRPPKKHKTPEELAQEAAVKERELQSSKQERREDEPTGKRKRKAPTRFQEVVQGKELEKIFIEEGVTDGEESEPEFKLEVDKLKLDPVPKVPEVIGHTDSGELVVVVKGKGRGRPKGPLNQKRQKCAICDKEFSCSGRYMSHVAQHGPVLYQCAVCIETFPTRLDFTRHQEDTAHTGQNVIPRDSTEDVAASKPEKVAAKCDTSEALADAPTPAEGAAGALPDLNPDPAEGEVPTTKTDLLKVEIEPDVESEAPEVKQAEEEPVGKVKLKCPHCDKVFSSKQSRSMHVKAIHKGERSYACSECGATFAYPRALALHALKHRTRASKGYACDLCGKVLNHPSSVTYHKEAEHAGQKFVCNKCGKCFKHKQLLQRHQLVHTQNRPFHCKVCNATFKTKANLMNHQLLHSGVKKYSCELCKQRFAHKTSLTLHVRWHNGQKPYVCKICGKAFSQKGNLSEHARIHTGEKPFQCAQCPRRFTTSSQHRLHLRRHNNDNKAAAARAPAAAGGAPPACPPGAAAGGYRCGWCARVWASRWALAKHARRHTGERPFKCPQCPRAFADCSNLNKHKKHVHKQTSLLASPRARPAPPAPLTQLAVVDSSHGGLNERVIYVTYDVDDAEPDYRLVDDDEAEQLLSQAGATRELYELQADPPQEHMSVTDEQGNPLHFTMQDGTQLAITSLDGQSLQVITQDGQTIPVEINGFSPEDVQQMADSNTIVHEINVQKTEDEEPSSPVTHYYTIV